MKTALVTGASGFLGSNLSVALRDAGWQVWGTWHQHEFTLKSVQARRLDICIPSAIASLMDEAKPDAVFHLSALADPELCAADIPACRQINVAASKSMAEAAEKRGAKFIFSSTDLVFGGGKQDFSESDTAKPLGAYGKSKLDAEQAALAATGGKALIARVALSYGWGRAVGRGFAENWIKSFLMGQGIRAFMDQWRSPIYVPDLISQLLKAVELDLKGVYHAGGPERLSRGDFAHRLAKEFQFPQELIIPSSMNDVVFRDPRPDDVSLNSKRLAAATGLEAAAVNAGLARMHQDLQNITPNTKG